MNISMILSSCDNYSDTWYPFLYQMKKYWPEFNNPIYLITESKRIDFPGYDLRFPLDYHGSRRLTWSEMLLQTLEQVESDFVFFMLDDFWLTRKVDNNEFERYLKILSENKEVGFICLKQEVKGYSPQIVKDNVVDCEYPGLWECKKKKPYRITTQAGIWRKDYLRKVIRRHESAWQFENRGNWRSQFISGRVFDVKKSVFEYPICGVLTGGKVIEEYISLYDHEIINHCKARSTCKYDERNPSNLKRDLHYYIEALKSVMPKW